MLEALATLLSAAIVTAPLANAACPNADAIASELDRLGASAALAALGSPEVTIEAGKMRVVLRARDGSTMGVREIEAPTACHERASVAAVFVAAWVGAWATQPIAILPSSDRTTAAPATDKRKQRTSPTPPSGRGTARIESPPLPSRAVSERPAAPAPPPAPAPSPPATPPRSSDRAVAHAAQRSAQTGPWPTVEVAGLAFATHDGDAGTFGAGVFSTCTISDSLAVAALLETTGERDAAVGSVIATHRTSRLGVGVSLRRRWGRLFTDAAIFPELTMLEAKGQPLVVVHKVTTWGAAVDARGRLGLAFGRFLPFLFAGASAALRAEHLTLDDRPGSAATLSRWSFSAGMGVAILFGAPK